MNCPKCNKPVSINTPDYGFGYGTEYVCYNCPKHGGRFTFTSKSKQAREESDASRALSAENARRIFKRVKP